ncbi:MAG: branched-chain amino acid ABC transporter permease [Acidimicrobiales bacterium]
MTARRRVASRAAAAVAGIALLLAVPHLLPGWVGFFVTVGIFFLPVTGLNLLMGYGGQVSLGQTVFLAGGAYGAGLLSVRLGVPTLAALVVAAVVCAAVAGALGQVFLRLRGLYLALATLGLAVIVEQLVTALVSLTGGPSGLVGVPGLSLGPFTLVSATDYYYLLALLGVLGAWFARNIAATQTGRALAAIAADQEAAAMLGIKPSSYKTRAFVLSAVYASVAGSVDASYSRFISPDSVAVLVALSIVIMLALGGFRTVLGPLVGAIAYQIVPKLGQGVSLYEPLVAGLVLVLVMTYLPSGIWGSVRQLGQAALGPGRWPPPAADPVTVPSDVHA